MTIHNTEIAEIFGRLADLLDIEGSNPFRVRAYRNASQTIADLPHPVAEMVNEHRKLSGIPGIGSAMAEKIREIVETGDLAALHEIESRVPAGLLKLMDIQGLGPKKVAVLYRELKVASIGDLEKAAREGRIRNLKGFGAKTEEKILHELARADKGPKRFRLIEAEEMAEPILARLRKVPGVDRVIIAGSYRRGLETVGDLDILVTADAGAPVMDAFVHHEDAAEVVSHGDTRSTIILRRGMQVDLRLVPRESYGAALQYFTGSKNHGIALRKIAQRMDLKLNEYGVFKGDTPVAGRSEEEVYAVFGLPCFEPEIREDRGEIQAALEGRLPNLVRREDIRGDLHAHTTETDGHDTLEEMAEAGRERGYEYVAITDHSRRVAVARGMDEARLAAQIKAIDRLNARLAGMVLLKSVEVDILDDGRLDLADDILRELDLVTASVHFNFNFSEDEMTGRIIRAMDNPYMNILAHPTGRLIGEREPYRVNIEKIVEAARDRGCFLEINAHPDRLDLNDVHAKLAKDLGVKVSISTDAHKAVHLDLIRFGIRQARRGWIEPGDVINTRSLGELKKLLRRN